MVELKTGKTQGRDVQGPTERTPEQWRTSEPHGRRWPALVIVALISIALGVGGVLAALRLGWIAAPGGATGHEVGTAGQALPAAGANSMPGMAGSSEARPEGGSDKAVYISPARQQMIGVRTARVTHEALDTTIRTVGVLAYDETRTTMVHTKVAGWIDREYVDFVGKPVKRGQPLFTVYSPELVATQNEYLLALKAKNQLGSSKIAETRNSADSLLAATRERLKLWDISDEQIADLERTGQPRKNVTLYAPFDGIVLERNAFAGQYISPDMNTFKLADLSTIWVIAQVFEYELRLVKVGQEADIQFPYGESGRSITGHVGFIYPDIDPETRRARVRIEFPNPGLALKPGSYVTASIKTGGTHSLALPKEAVIDTGAKQYAIVALPNGYFDPREVQVGQPNDKFYPVVSGVTEGDVVVTSAQFMVDSEANLQEAMKAMSATMPGMDMGGDKKEQPSAAPKKKPAGQSDMEDMPGMDMTGKRPAAKEPAVNRTAQPRKGTPSRLPARGPGQAGAPKDPTGGTGRP